MRLNKSASLLAAVFIAASLPVGPASASATFTDVDNLSFGEIGYNAYGPDRSWNRNQEFVDITNKSGAPVDVKGLRVEDAWAHGRGDGAGKCNNFTIATLPGIDIPAEGDNKDKLLLADQHTVRVYVGSGDPKVFGDGLRWHAVYMNSDPGCGYYGHFLNNTAQKDKAAPWDAVWMSKGGASKSKSYNFSRGYTAP